MSSALIVLPSKISRSCAGSVVLEYHSGDGEIEWLAAAADQVVELIEREFLHLDIDAEWLQVAADDLRLLKPRRHVGRVHDRCRVDVSGELPCPAEVRAGQRVEMEVGGAGGGGQHVAVGRASCVEGIDVGEALALGGQRRPVDRVVDREPQPDIGEQRPARVHVQDPYPVRGADEVLLVSCPGRLAARSVLRLEPRPGVAREAVDRVVGRARLDFGESAGAVDPDREDHLVEVMRAVAVVIGVPPQDQLLVW